MCTHSLSVYLPYILALGIYTPLSTHSHCALANGVCTSLLSLRPQTHLSQQHSVPDVDVGEDRHSTLTVPFNTGREDRLGEGQLALRFASHNICVAQPGLLCAGIWLRALRTSEQVC